MDVSLLATRCAVLKNFGYCPESASVESALSRLSTEEYDLIIVSAGLTSDERKQILSIRNGTQALLLHGLTTPAELLTEAARLIGRRAG
jgi:hypothetical protein